MKLSQKSGGLLFDSRCITSDKVDQCNTDKKIEPEECIGLLREKTGESKLGCLCERTIIRDVSYASCATETT